MDVADILSYNAELANYVLDNPTESLPLVHSLSLDISARRPIFLASHYGIGSQINAAQPPACGSLGS